MPDTVPVHADSFINMLTGNSRLFVFRIHSIRFGHQMVRTERVRLSNDDINISFPLLGSNHSHPRIRFGRGVAVLPVHGFTRG